MGYSRTGKIPVTPSFLLPPSNLNGKLFFKNKNKPIRLILSFIFFQAHACILVFDATRKTTYKNLNTWYAELRSYRPSIPCLCAVNKIDGGIMKENIYLILENTHCNHLFFSECPESTKKSFLFASKNNLPMYYVSASDGTNVVKMFSDAVEKAVEYKKNPIEIEDQILEELERL